MFEKTMRMSYLYDFYAPLLTPKQQNYMSLYYLEDYSLGEIAEQFDVSRQAVHDTLRRTESMLKESEEKLKLFSKFQKRMALLEDLKQLRVRDKAVSEKMLTIIDSLEKLD